VAQISLSGSEVRVWLVRWLAEPHQLILTIVALVALFSLSVVFVHRLLATPALDAEGLAKARSGVIILKSADPTFCRQRTLDNQASIGKQTMNNCENDLPVTMPHSSGQLDTIRRGFRGGN
jgi:hypothetical protein